MVLFSFWHPLAHVCPWHIATWFCLGQTILARRCLRYIMTCSLVQAARFTWNDMMTDLICSLPPENGLLPPQDSGEITAFFSGCNLSVFVCIAPILIRPWKDIHKVGHGRPLMQMVIKYQIMIYWYMTQVHVDNSKSGKWSFPVDTLTNPGFNLTLRSSDNMQIWWRHIRRNTLVETNKNIWEKVGRDPSSIHLRRFR